MKKLLFLVLLVTFSFVGCNKETNNVSQQQNNTNTQQTIKKEPKLPNGIVNKDFYNDSKKSYTLISTLMNEGKLLEDNDSTLRDYIKKYSVDKSLNEEETKMYKSMEELMMNYSQYHGYVKQKLTANSDNMKKVILESLGKYKESFDQ